MVNLGNKIIDNTSTKELEEFREYFYGKFVKLFEKACEKAKDILKTKIDKKKKEELDIIIKDSFLKVSSEGIYSFAYLTLIIFLIIGALLFLIFSDVLFLFFFIILSYLSYTLILYYPKYLYYKVQSKKEGQLIFAVLYLAMKLRQTSNLEKAVEYTAKYLQPPLKLDFLKILWDFYNRKVPTIMQALDDYAMKWEDRAFYFTMGIRLLISSIHEPDPIRRESLIDKAVEEALDNLYDQISIYVREIQSPINLIYMLGIVLPTMILTLFPIMGVILSDIFNPRFLFILFDVALPAMIFMLVKQSVEGKRVEFSTTEDKYLYLYMKKHKTRIGFTSILSGIVVFFIVLFFVIYIFEGFIKNYTLFSVFVSGAFILALGLAIAAAHYIYYLHYKDFITRLDKIDREISSLLFQLSSRLYQGIPLEHAFADIYKNFRKKDIGKFILNIFKNMKLLGMSTYDAIFNKEHGALVSYPSSLLESSMEILTESVRHSLDVASKAVLAIARYFMYLNKTKQRLLDLLAEVTAQMKTLAKVIGPAITGLIVSISIMTINILLKLGIAIQYLQTSSTFSEQTNIYGIGYVPMELLDIFNIKKAVSPGTIYLIIGLYTIAITYLLAYMLNIIENGKNPIKEKYYIATYIFFAVILYTIIALISAMFLWNLAEMLGNILKMA